MISFDETSEAYHANPATGSTDVRACMRSPRLYADTMAGLCRRETPALLFGIASHMRLLEPDAFFHIVAVKPAGMSFATNEGKLWAAKAAGRLIVSAADATHLQYMHERMPAAVRAIFDASRKEVTIRNEIGGLAVQCRPDLWDIDGREFNDLKTIDSIEKIDKAIWSHRYDVQIAWYRRVILIETGIKIRRSRLIFVEKVPPYRWRIIELDVDYQALGDQAVDEVLAQIHARTKSGCWDDPGDLYDIASPPEWAAGSVPEITDEEEDDE